MALAKSEVTDKVEIVSNYHALNVRTKIIITDGETVISESFTRRVLLPLQRNATGTDWEPTDLSSEDSYIQAIAGAVWDDAARDGYREVMEENDIPQ